MEVKMSNTLKTYVALILDKSGSMDNIREEARSHFNEQLQVLKEESNSPKQMAKNLLKGRSPKALETKATFVIFNQKVETPIFNKDVNEIKELDKKDYVPDGMTALWDAIGLTIDKFLQLPDISDPDVSILFTIITDGKNNSSTKYAGADGCKKLKSQIEDLQGTKRWTFTFLGANQDVMETAVADLSLLSGNVMKWTNDTAGTKYATAEHTTALRSYYSGRRLGKTDTTAFYDNSIGDNIKKKDVNADAKWELTADEPKKKKDSK